MRNKNILAVTALLAAGPLFAADLSLAVQDLAAHGGNPQ
jgi:hypothetical protein